MKVWLYTYLEEVTTIAGNKHDTYWHEVSKKTPIEWLKDISRYCGWKGELAMRRCTQISLTNAIECDIPDDTDLDELNDSIDTVNGVDEEKEI